MANPKPEVQQRIYIWRFCDAFDKQQALGVLGTIAHIKAIKDTVKFAVASLLLGPLWTAEKVEKFDILQAARFRDAFMSENAESGAVEFQYHEFQYIVGFAFADLSARMIYDKDAPEQDVIRIRSLVEKALKNKLNYIP